MTTVNILGSRFSKFEGYGYMTLKLIEHIQKAGDPTVRAVPLTIDQVVHWPAWLRDYAGIDLTDLTVHIGQPDDFENIGVIPGRVWLYTMYETTHIPLNWPDVINSNYERVIVPCQHNKEVFERCGVEVPVHVVPLGIEPAELPFDFRTPPVRSGRPMVFMTIADRGLRKGFELVMQAFYEAFGDQDDVRLIIKSREDDEQTALFNLAEMDSRYSVWSYDVPERTDIYHYADCFVFPSKGEGFGLPPREATVTGKPTIATKWAGMDDVDKWGIPLTDLTLRPPYGMKDKVGKWAVPSVSEIAKQMRWVYNNYDEAQHIALRGSQYLVDNFTWAEATRKFVNLILEQTDNYYDFD